MQTLHLFSYVSQVQCIAIYLYSLKITQNLLDICINLVLYIDNNDNKMTFFGNIVYLRGRK